MADDVAAAAVVAAAVAVVVVGAGDVVVVEQRFVAPVDAYFVVVVVRPASTRNDAVASDDDVVNLKLDLRCSEDFPIMPDCELSNQEYHTVIHRYGDPLARHLDADEVAFDRAGCRL